MVPVGMSTAADDVAERIDDVRRGTRAGESASAIARRLGVSQRTVERYRTRLRETGRLPR